jgi:two-component system phosphate regulon sensor histidine kinase PhoR
MAVAGLVVAAAVTLPFFFLGERGARLVLAAAISVAAAIVSALLAFRRRRRQQASLAERRTTHEELDRAERRYQALVGALPLVAWLYEAGDRSSTFRISPQIEAMLGYSPEEWVAERDMFAKLLHPEDRERVLSEIKTTTKAVTPIRTEYRLLARDGRVVWVREHGTTVRSSDGEPLYGQSFLLDIGERKRADEERDRLRAAERAAASKTVERQRRLDLLREAAEVATSSLDYKKTIQRIAELVVREFADWCVVDVSEEGTPLQRLAVARTEPGKGEIGIAPDQEAEEAVRAVVESGEAKVVPPLGESSEGGDSDRFLGEIDTRSVICVPLRARMRPLGAITVARTEPGEAYGADDLAFMEDLAGRIALAVDRTRLYLEVEERADAARVLAHVADGVLLLDSGGIVRLWNPAAEGITAIPAAEVVGRSAAEAIRGWQEAVDSVPVSTSPDPGHAEVVIPIETERGERWVAISGVQFFGGTVYAFRDLTDVRHLEELKADFIATASHELRTPLAAVYGAAQTLLRHDFALDEGGRDRFVSLIAEESERLGRIVNEILLANQLDAGRLDLEAEPFDAVELVDRVVEATRAYAPPGVSVDRVVPDGVPRVDADRDKVRQVLVNLVENAIKYSPDGGRVEVGVETREETVLFYVKDEGLGIPGEEQSRVFEKFYRVDPQMTRGVGGTGLGLYICNELVSRMGGHIWVESTAGEGSTFLFDLPAAGLAAARAAERVSRSESVTP